MSEVLAAVRRYYDQNTRLFLKWGSSREARAMHRALWPAGVSTLAAALEHSQALALAAAPPGARRVADLGCGVGAGLFYLLARLPAGARGLGLTLSPVQARLAGQAARRLALSQALIVEGDYQNVPAAGGFDLAYSIEAFVHAPDPQRYLSEAARLLRPGGRLALCDDFRAERTLAPAEQAWLAAYQSGWQAVNVRPAPQVIEQAGQAGLRLLGDRDLTHMLRLRALPDRLARAVLALGRRLPLKHALLPSMLGSLALQQCLRDRLVLYRLLVFEKD